MNSGSGIGGHVEFNDLFYFLMVVERGGYSSAERSLGIPKSRLSRRISALEKRLGVRLLQRSSRRIIVTAAGELLLQHCKTMHAGAQAGLDAIASLQESPRGAVRIGCSANSARLILAPALNEFMEMYPEITAEIVITNPWVDLYDAAVDIALRVRTEIAEAGGVVVRPLLQVRQKLVIAAHLLRGRDAPHTPADLDHFPTLTIPSGTGHFTWQFTQGNGPPVDLRLKPRLVCADVDILRQAAIAGMGVARLSTLMCDEDIAAGRLAEIMPDWALPVHHVYLALLSTKRPPSRNAASHRPPRALDPPPLRFCSGPFHGSGEKRSFQIWNVVL